MNKSFSIYYVQDLKSASSFLSNYKNSVTITNSLSAIRSYGMLVLDYIFNKLKEDFNQISKVIVNVGDDKSALFTALKLSYQLIIYQNSVFKPQIGILNKEIIKIINNSF